MFDDPKKDLKWLEQQLKAEENPQQEASAEDWFEEEEDWLDAQLREAHALLGDAPVRRSSSEDIFRFLEEEEESKRADYSAPPRKSPQEKKVRKEKGVGGLVFLACLETLGIIAVLIWWALWLL